MEGEFSPNTIHYTFGDAHDFTRVHEQLLKNESTYETFRMNDQKPVEKEDHYEEELRYREMYQDMRRRNIRFFIDESKSQVTFQNTQTYGRQSFTFPHMSTKFVEGML